MRRLDVLKYGLGLLVLGPLLYFVLQAIGLPAVTAGIWVQTLFGLGIIAWLGTYFFRVFFSKMTYQTQLKDYKQAVVQKRAEEYIQNLEKAEEETK